MGRSRRRHHGGGHFGGRISPSYYPYAHRGYYGGVPSFWAYPQVYGWVPRPVITQINRPRQVNVAGETRWVQDMLGYGFPTMAQMAPNPRLAYTKDGKTHSVAVLGVGNTRRWLTFQAPEGGLFLGPHDRLTLTFMWGDDPLEIVYYGRNLRQSDYWR